MASTEFCGKPSRIRHTSMLCCARGRVSSRAGAGEPNATSRAEATADAARSGVMEDLEAACAYPRLASAPSGSRKRLTVAGVELVTRHQVRVVVGPAPTAFAHE